MTRHNDSLVGRASRPRGSTLRIIGTLTLALSLGACSFQPVVCGEWPPDGQGGPPRIRTKSHQLCAVAREAVGTEFEELHALPERTREELYAVVDRAGRSPDTATFLADVRELGAPRLAEHLRKAIAFANERSQRPDDTADEATVRGRLEALRRGLLLGLEDWFPPLRPAGDGD